MASASRPNHDLPSIPLDSFTNLHSNHSPAFGSMSMEEILKNIYSDSESFALDNNGVAGGVVGSSALEGDGRNGTNGSENGWQGIVGSGGGGSGEPAMTLEDFLAKSGAVSEEDVRDSAVVTMAPPLPRTTAFGMETVKNAIVGVAAAQFAPAACMQNGPTDEMFGVEFGNGVGVVAVAGSGGASRGKRRTALEEAPLDKATQQKQKRMIKNRESAARSRERKQAFTVELESVVTQLEEEKARLLKEELMENLIPVTEKLRPPRVLRKVCSMSW